MASDEEGAGRSQELAELKSWLERRISELSAELERLRAVMRYVDELLAESSFRRADSLVTRRATEEVRAPHPEERPSLRTIRSRSGTALATLTYTQDVARFVLNPDIVVTKDHRPFASFLLKKVLEGYVNQDMELVSRGLLDANLAFSYEVVYEGERVKEIEVRNYREEARLREIINAVRWTLETALA